MQRYKIHNSKKPNSSASLFIVYNINTTLFCIVKRLYYFRATCLWPFWLKEGCASFWAQTFPRAWVRNPRSAFFIFAVGCRAVSYFKNRAAHAATYHFSLQISAFRHRLVSSFCVPVCDGLVAHTAVRPVVSVICVANIRVIQANSPYSAHSHGTFRISKLT